MQQICITPGSSLICHRRSRHVAASDKRGVDKRHGRGMQHWGSPLNSFMTGTCPWLTSRKVHLSVCPVCCAQYAYVFCDCQVTFKRVEDPREAGLRGGGKAGVPRGGQALVGRKGLQ